MVTFGVYLGYIKINIFENPVKVIVLIMFVVVSNVLGQLYAEEPKA